MSGLKMVSILYQVRKILGILRNFWGYGDWYYFYDFLKKSW
jgi:hypothetical protein